MSLQIQEGNNNFANHSSQHSINNNQCEQHNQPLLYISTVDRSQLYCQICIQHQSSIDVIDYVLIDDEISNQQRFWGILKNRVQQVNTEQNKLLRKIAIIENNRIEVEEEKSSLIDEADEANNLKQKQKLQDHQYQEFLQKLQLLLGQNDKVLPDISTKLLLQAKDQLKQDTDTLQILTDNFNQLYDLVQQLIQNRRCPQLFELSRKYFSYNQALQAIEQNQQQISQFIQASSLNQNKDYQFIKELKKLDGLASLSVNQRSLWNAENELIKLYAQPEQKELLSQIFTMQNDLMDMLEKEAKGFHLKLRSQEDSLNYCKFQLSRANEKQSDYYIADIHISQKFNKYISNKVARVDLNSSKIQKTKHRQELINQLVQQVVSENNSFVNENQSNQNKQQQNDTSLVHIVHQFDK